MKRRCISLAVVLTVLLLTFWDILQSIENTGTAATTVTLQDTVDNPVVVPSVIKDEDTSDSKSNATTARIGDMLAIKLETVPSTTAQTTTASVIIPRQDNISTSTPCPIGSTLLQDITQPFSLEFNDINKKNERIPRVLYQTAKDQCIFTTLYNATIQKWIQNDVGDNKSSKNNKSPVLSYRFYDDARMHDNLYDFQTLQTIFPALPLALQCIDHVGNVPVMKADMWRYLILWQQGGIFADLDVTPSELLLRELLRNNSNDDDDDALFILVNTAGQRVLSQWLLAVSPHHPLMYYALEEAIFRVLKGKRAIPIQHTGPRALYDATDRFLNYNTSIARNLQVGNVYYQQNIDYSDENTTGTPLQTQRQQQPGSRRRSFRVLPASSAKNNVAGEAKSHAYELMNMTHYSDNKGKNKKPYNGTTCLEFLGGVFLSPDKTSYRYQGKNFSLRNLMPSSLE